jgi:AcrR family transcriptional regulator
MSSEKSSKRPYRMKARAERQLDTQRRIAAAAARLHEEVGPARTTIAEVARRAGVQRPTVYSHFPSERELYAACQHHFLAEHPPPDVERALALPDPGERLRATLALFYGWYRSTEATTGNVQRDRRLLPELDALLAETGDRRLDALADELAGGLDRGGRALIRLGLDFATWQRLAHEGLSDAEAADLMSRTAAAREPSGGSSGSRRSRHAPRS